ncbi:MAG: hypothetical protein MMC33_002172 [Icmadophila ericetorum]|nr:hypothetical protein [Icmadophila ericetorum]
MSHGSQKHSTSSFHFLAGLSTGCVSALLLQPADLLKTRLQQSRSASLLSTIRLITSSATPIRDLWRGTLPSIIRTGFGSALYFSTLNALRQNVAASQLLKSTPINGPVVKNPTSSSLPKLSNGANLLTGAMARAGAGFVMMPITIIKVRYESNLYTYKSIYGAARAILEIEGPKGFFTGFGATAMRDAPYAGLYVLFYEQAKKRLSKLQQSSNLSPPSTGGDEGIMKARTSISINALSGLIAASVATTITNPFDAVKTRLQLMPGTYKNVWTAAAKMVRDDGFRTLFDGLGLRMARKGISSALSWTLYEELVRIAEAKWTRE